MSACVELWHHRMHQMFLMNFLEGSFLFSLSNTFSSSLCARVCELKTQVYEVKTKGALSDGSFTHSPQLF